MIFNQPQDGITPHIGDNGNWFLGKNDTGVRANGQTNTELIPLTILASDWNTETGEVVVSCAGISANEADQIVTLIPSVESKAACNEAAIECVAIDNNSFTLKAETIPTEDIHIYVAMEVVGNVAGGTNNDVYSLEETVVGTWIDGKPIYRKTLFLHKSLTAGAWTLLCDISGLNIETIINSCACYVSEASTSGYYRIGNDEQMMIGVNKNKTTLNGHCVAELSNVYVQHATLEYTKTTDAATINLPDAAAMAASYEQGVHES